MSTLHTKKLACSYVLYCQSHSHVIQIWYNQNGDQCWQINNSPERKLGNWFKFESILKIVENIKKTPSSKKLKMVCSTLIEVLKIVNDHQIIIQYFKLLNIPNK